MLHEYFQDVLILLGSAILIVTIFNTLKVPPLVGFLGAGVVIGPHGLALVPSLPGTQIISEFGMILLLFTIGLEFSFEKLKEFKKSFIFLGVLQVFLTVALTTLIARFLNMPWEKCVLWGFLVCLSSTAVVLKLLHERRELETAHGHSTLSILLAQDILVIPMLLLLPLLAQTDANIQIDFSSVAMWIAKTVLIVSAVVLISKKIIPFVFEKIVETNSRELFFFFLIFVCLATAYVFESLGLSVSLGAFIAGIIIAESPFGKQVASDITPIRDNILGLFFITIGMLLDTQFIFKNLGTVLFLGSLVFVLKTAIVYLTLRLNHLAHTVSLLTALMLCQVGEFSFLLANAAVKLNLMGSDELQYFIAISVMSLAFTPLLFQVAPKLSQSKKFQTLFPKNIPSFFPKKDFQTEVKDGMQNHVVIIGYGLVGQNIVHSLKSLKIPYMIIEFNPTSFKKYSAEEKNIIFGDASSHEILEKSFVDTAKLVVVTASGMAEHLRAIHRNIRKLNQKVQVLIRVQYLRNALLLQKDEKTQLVVAEFETGLEVLNQTLRTYEIDPQQISELSQTYRVHFNQNLS